MFMSMEYSYPYYEIKFTLFLQPFQAFPLVGRPYVD